MHFLAGKGIRKTAERNGKRFVPMRECAEFSLAVNAEVPRNILLVDDMVDSGWTLTVCGHILTEAGADHVYPYALASTSKKED